MHKPYTLATALRTRQGDIRQTLRLLGRARYYRRNGDPRQAAHYLKLAHTRVACVRLSNATVRIIAGRLNLCPCSNACTCIAPF